MEMEELQTMQMIEVMKRMASELYFLHEQYFSGKLEGSEFSKKANETRTKILSRYGQEGISAFNDIYDSLVREGDKRKFSGH